MTPCGNLLTLRIKLVFPFFPLSKFFKEVFLIWMDGVMIVDDEQSENLSLQSQEANEKLNCDDKHDTVFACTLSSCSACSSFTLSSSPCLARSTLAARPVTLITSSCFSGCGTQMFTYVHKTPKFTCLESTGIESPSRWHQRAVACRLTS